MNESINISFYRGGILMDHDKNKPDDKEAQEDDISIDFSKIKGFFSGKDSKHVKEHNKNNKETKNLDVEEDKEKKSNLQDKVHDKSLNDKDSEEDVEIDFSKIKSPVSKVYISPQIDNY